MAKQAAEEFQRDLLMLKKDWREIERCKEENNKKKEIYNKLIECKHCFEISDDWRKYWEKRMDDLEAQIIKEDERLKIETEKLKRKATESEEEFYRIMDKIKSNIGKQEMDQDEDDGDYEMQQQSNDEHAGYLAFMKGIEQQIESEETHETDTITMMEEQNCRRMPDVDPLADLGFDELIYNQEGELIEQELNPISRAKMRTSNPTKFIPPKFKPPRQSKHKAVKEKKQWKFIELKKQYQLQLFDDVVKLLDVLTNENIYPLIVQNTTDFISNDHDGIIDDLNIEQQFNWFFMQQCFQGGFHGVDQCYEMSLGSSLQ